MTLGRGADLAWPRIAKGNAPGGGEDRRREPRGAATAEDQCSSVVRACREEGKKKQEITNRAQTHRGEWGAEASHGLRTEERPKEDQKKKHRARRQREYG